MRGGLHGIMTWLVLVLSLLAGIAPARGVVVCFEADGTAVLELGSEAARCGGCPGTQGQVGGPRDCPCIDLPLSPGSGLQAKRDLPGSSSPPLASIPPSAWAVALAGAACSAPLARSPRPAPGLALLRTVVLRV